MQAGEKVLRRLLSTCDYLLQKYPTTYEHDVDMLATPGAKVILWGRKQAMRALMSEKLALQAAQENIQRILNKLRSGSSLDSLEIVLYLEFVLVSAKAHSRRSLASGAVEGRDCSKADLSCNCKIGLSIEGDDKSGEYVRLMVQIRTTLLRVHGAGIL